MSDKEILSELDKKAREATKRRHPAGKKLRPTLVVVK